VDATKTVESPETVDDLNRPIGYPMACSLIFREKDDLQAFSDYLLPSTAAAYRIHGLFRLDSMI
jgi:hypothetical protein